MPFNSPNHFPIKGHAVIYRGNGTGRDTYIQSNSGGFFKAPKTHHQHDTGSFPIRSSSAARSTAPRLDGKTVYYRTDGTGRDAYINTNSGGFSKAFGGGNFFNNLRTYQKIVRPPSRTGNRPTSSYKNPNESIELRVQGSNLLGKPLPITNDQRIEIMKKKMVNNLVSRLSLPKRSDSPFKNSQHPEYQRTRCRSATTRAPNNSDARLATQESRLKTEERAQTLNSSRRESVDNRHNVNLNRSLNLNMLKMSNNNSRKNSVDVNKPADLIASLDAKILKPALKQQQRPSSCLRSRGSTRL